MGTFDDIPIAQQGAFDDIPISKGSRAALAPANTMLGLGAAKFWAPNAQVDARAAADKMSDAEKFWLRTGRIMGGSSRGISQFVLGDTPEMAENRLRAQALADSQGNWGGVGAQALGALADPVTLPLLALKVPGSLLGWARQGAGVGGIQGAVGEVSPGDSRLVSAFAGTVGGALLGPAAGKGLNMLSRGAANVVNLLGGNINVPTKIPLRTFARVSQNVADTVIEAGRKVTPFDDIPMAKPVEVAPIVDVVPMAKPVEVAPIVDTPPAPITASPLAPIDAVVPQLSQQVTKPSGIHVVETPVASLRLSKDVPQFKSDADTKGVVSRLEGKYDRALAAPVQVWERADGSMEVISGRHRLDLAQRSGEITIPTQIHREVDGFTAAKAVLLDIELNVKDGRGKVKDYVRYFQAVPVERSEATQRGLLQTAVGRDAYAIAVSGSDELIASHGAAQLSDQAAVAIAQAAPKDQRLQAVGLKLIIDGKPIHTAVNTMRAVGVMASERKAAGVQGDIFGFDDSAMLEAIEMAKGASKAQREISEQIAAVSGAAKRPDIARKMGVDVTDPEGIQKRILELRKEQGKWDNWATHPELVAKLRGEPAVPPLVLQAETNAQIQAREAAERATTLSAQRVTTAPSSNEFTLSGSSRAADEAAASGAQELFGSGQGTLSFMGTAQMGKATKELGRAWTKYAGTPLHQLGVQSPGTTISGVSGGVIGWNSSDDDATTIEKTSRAAAGFMLGVIGGKTVGKIPLGDKNVSEWLSRGIINNYGRNENVVAAQEAMAMFRSHAGAEWVDLVKDVGKLSATQRRTLYSMLQGEAPKQADLLSLDDKSRTIITKYGRMMVDTGMLGAETQAKNEATYLHREYTSKLTGNKYSIGGSKLAKFAADELRPRGVMFDVPEADAKLYVEAGSELWGKPRNGIQTLRRQLTKPEREALGEIEDAGYAIARTGQLMTRDLSVYKFYDDLAKNPAVAQDFNPGGWVQIQEGRVPGTKLAKFGNLEGKFVPKEVYDDLNQLRTIKQITDQSFVQWYLYAHNAWKVGKTALNPVVHVNNVMSNFPLYDLSDSSWGALLKGGKQITRGGQDYELAKSMGVFDVNMTQQELHNMATSMADSFKGVETNPAHAATNLARKTWNVTGGAMIKTYQAEDNVFRLGIFIDRLEKGGTPEYAAAEAKRWMIDYSINAPVIQAARNTIIPFAGYTYRVVPLLYEAATLRPWKFAKWAAAGYLANEVGEKYGGGDTPKERALMSSQERGRIFGIPVMPPQMIKLPTRLMSTEAREKIGIFDTSQYLDITRWIPGGDVMDAAGDRKMIPFLPAPLQPGGVGFAVGQGLVGYDQFTGKKLAGLGISDAEDAKIKGKYLLQQMLPNNPVVPGSFAQDKIIRSLKGLPSPMADKLPLWQAIAQTTGFKIKPADLSVMQIRTMFDAKQDVDAIGEQIRQQHRAMTAGKVTQEEYESYALERLGVAQKIMGKLQKRLNPPEPKQRGADTINNLAPENQNIMSQ